VAEAQIYPAETEGSVDIAFQCGACSYRLSNVRFGSKAAAQNRLNSTI